MGYSATRGFVILLESDEKYKGLLVAGMCREQNICLLVEIVFKFLLRQGAKELPRSKAGR